MPKCEKYHAKWKANMAKCTVANTRQMVPGKKAKKNPKPEGNKKSKNYSTPEFLPGSKEKLRPHVIGAGILYGNGTALRKL